MDTVSSDKDDIADSGTRRRITKTVLKVEWQQAINTAVGGGLTVLAIFLVNRGYAMHNFMEAGSRCTAENCEMIKDRILQLEQVVLAHEERSEEWMNRIRRLEEAVHQQYRSEKKTSGLPLVLREHSQTRTGALQ